MAVQHGLAAKPAKPPPDFVLPLERSDIGRSSLYDLESYDDFEDLLEGSLDRADAPPPADDTCNTEFVKLHRYVHFLYIYACKHLIFELLAWLQGLTRCLIAYAIGAIQAKTSVKTAAWHTSIL